MVPTIASRLPVGLLSSGPGRSAIGLLHLVDLAKQAVKVLPNVKPIPADGVAAGCEFPRPVPAAQTIQVNSQVFCRLADRQIVADLRYARFTPAAMLCILRLGANLERRAGPRTPWRPSRATGAETDTDVWGQSAFSH